MNPRITRIRMKIDALRYADEDLDVFGAKKHKYKMNPPLSLQALQDFENEFGVKLPKGYADFLTQIGNGGAGPFEGLLSLEEARIGVFDPQGNHTYNNVSRSFPYNKKWSNEEEMETLYEKMDAAEAVGNVAMRERLHDEQEALMNNPENRYGRLELCDYGFGVSLFLVVKGAAKGIVWADDSMSDGGIYPFTEFSNNEPVGFLDWYEHWLDFSAESIGFKIPGDI